MHLLHRLTPQLTEVGTAFIDHKFYSLYEHLPLRSYPYAIRPPQPPPFTKFQPLSLPLVKWALRLSIRVTQQNQQDQGSVTIRVLLIVRARSNFRGALPAEGTIFSVASGKVLGDEQEQNQAIPLRRKLNIIDKPVIPSPIKTHDALWLRDVSQIVWTTYLVFWSMRHARVWHDSSAIDKRPASPPPATFSQGSPQPPLTSQASMKAQNNLMDGIYSARIFNFNAIRNYCRIALRKTQVT